MPRPLLALLLLLPVPSLGAAAGMFWWPDSDLGQTLFMLSKIWIVALPLFWHLRVERQPLSLSPARKGGFGPALLLGIPVALLIAGAYLLIRNLGWIDPAIIGGLMPPPLRKPAIYIGAAIYWITVNSLIEEYVWRWFVFRQFERLIGGRAAIVASALGFTAHHIVAMSSYFDWGINAIASFGVFTGGLIWSWLYLRYRSVWPCWLCHACADIPIFVIGWFLIFG